MFVPGLGLPGSAFSGVTPAFTSQYRVITVDPRGAGQSDAPDSPISTHDAIGDMLAVLDAAGVEQVHVVGLSMGGMIGQLLAIEASARVASLVLLSTYAAVDGWSGRAMRLRRKLLVEFGVLDQFELAILMVSSPRTVDRAGDLVDAFEAGLRAAPPTEHGYLHQLNFCLRHDATASLGRITCPALVITGSEDILTPPHQGVALAAGIPDATYREVEGASHALVWETPEIFAEEVLAFLSWQEGDRSVRRASSLRVGARPTRTYESLSAAQTTGPINT